VVIGQELFYSYHLQTLLGSQGCMQLFNRLVCNKGLMMTL